MRLFVFTRHAHSTLNVEGRVNGDPSALQQTIFQLLARAVAVTPPRDRIEVRLERVGANARLYVSDSGGPPAQAARVAC